MIDRVKKLLESTNEWDVWIGLNLASNTTKEEFESLIGRNFTLNTRINGDYVVTIHGTEYVVYGIAIWVRTNRDTIYEATELINLDK